MGSPSLLVEVLGPLRLIVDDVPVEVRGPRRRAVLAMLALAEGRTVTVVQLLESLWPSAPPESGRQTLQTHVSRLRNDFGAAAGRLQTGYDGYRLELGADDLDVTRAKSLLAAARAAKAVDPGRALADLRSAHALWRGPMLADLVDVTAIEIAVEGYGRLYREVTDALIGCAIELGQAESVLGLASTSLAGDPLRESAVLLLMRGLAATGQPAEALQTGRSYRHLLADEVGLDPSPALDRLEHDIASGTADPAAGAPAVGESRARATHAGTAGRPGSQPSDRPGARLIGRDAQVAALHLLLAEQRLVTVVGPGGVGKSRVADEVARPDGSVAVLLLAPITEPLAIPHALAAALKLTVMQGDVLTACLAVLADRPGLLVIDNCEHLLDAIRDLVDTILSACPGVTILTTSRERLGLADEFVFRLAPLPLPADRNDLSPDLPALRQVPSVAVFLDRASRVRHDRLATAEQLQLVADIVRRLDGMPLAIELAAGRLSSFSLRDLHQRLDRALDLLGSGRVSGDARHRTLRTTIEWSYELLPLPEQRLFRYLSVFVDGVDLDGAERLAAQVCPGFDPGSLLAHLVDASMIDADLASGSRYRMLEMLRAFGFDRLIAAGEEETAGALFLGWAVELTGWLQTTLSSAQEPAADGVLRLELPNLRAAWRLARRSRAVNEAATIIVRLFDAIAYRDLTEIRYWAEELADDLILEGHPLATAVLGTAAEAAYHRGDYGRAEQLARAGLDRAPDTTGLWLCFSALSVADLARGEFADAVDHALAAASIGPRPGENLVVAALACIYAGDLGRARTLNEQVLVTAVSPTTRAWQAYVAGELESSAGQPELAERHYVGAIELARTSGASFLVGVATVGLLSVRVAAGRIQEALTGYREVIDYFDRTGNWTHQWTTLRNLANLLRQLGDHEPAGRLDAAADLAPDAPANNRSGSPGDPGTRDTAVPATIQGRSEILQLAHQSIAHHLRDYPGPH